MVRGVIRLMLSWLALVAVLHVAAVSPSLGLPSLEARRDGTPVEAGRANEAARHHADRFLQGTAAPPPPAGSSRRVIVWGKGSEGVSNIPADIAALTNVKAVAAGVYHAMVLLDTGEVKTWGDEIPGILDVPADLKNVVAISAGFYFSVALLADGTVRAWGNDTSGFGMLNVPGNLPFVQRMKAGGAQVMALTSNGSLVMWGDNRYNQCSVPPSVSNVVDFATGYDHSIALLSNGSVVAWGDNFSGQTQVPPGLSGQQVIALSAGADHSLALLQNGAVVVWGDCAYFSQCIVPLAAQSNVVEVAGGNTHSLARLRTGEVVAWGSNLDGETSVPAGLNNAVAIAAGGQYSLAIVADGVRPPSVPAPPEPIMSPLPPGPAPPEPLLSPTPPAPTPAPTSSPTSPRPSLPPSPSPSPAPPTPSPALPSPLNNSPGSPAPSVLIPPPGPTATLSSSSSKGVSTGMVAGVAIGAAVGVAVLAGLAWWLVKRHPHRGTPSNPQPPSESDANMGKAPLTPPDYGPNSNMGGANARDPWVAVQVVTFPDIGTPPATGPAGYVSSNRNVSPAVKLNHPDSTISYTSAISGPTSATGTTNAASSSRLTGGSSLPGVLEGTGSAHLTQAMLPLPQHQARSTSNLLNSTTTSQAVAQVHTRPRSQPSVNQSSGALSQGTASQDLDEEAVYQRNVLNRLKIAWSSIEIGRELGRGGFGTVTKGVWQSNAVAVKMLNLDKLSSQAQGALHREALAMCDLRHPCVAQVYGLVDDGTHCALVMRYYRNGTVYAAIDNPEYADLGLVPRLRMAQQVASGMCCLHERSLLHGDLKTSNLLIEDNGRGVVIADFGLAGIAGQAVAGGALTPSISPPEVLNDPTAPRTQAGDVYAFSIVLLEIVSGRFAYQNMKAEQLKEAICAGRRATIPACVPEYVAEIITACWSQDAADRPSFPKVLDMLGGALEKAAKDEGGSEAYNTATITGMWALKP